MAAANLASIFNTYGRRRRLFLATRSALENNREMTLQSASLGEQVVP